MRNKEYKLIVFCLYKQDHFGSNGLLLGRKVKEKKLKLAVFCTYFDWFSMVVE